MTKTFMSNDGHYGLVPIVFDHKDGLIISVSLFTGIFGMLVAGLATNLPVVGFLTGVLIGLVSTIKIIRYSS